MLQICPKLPDQQFEELLFGEEILTFLRDIGHSGEIKVINDVNVNKLHQPWRSFAVVIKKCLSGKSYRDMTGVCCAYDVLVVVDTPDQEMKNDIGCEASDFHQRSLSNKAAKTGIHGSIDEIDIHARDILIRVDL
ncbi:hypothetical protein Tco_0826540 [Tanacetum coccineum]